jgi:hypothetical protein
MEDLKAVASGRAHKLFFDATATSIVPSLVGSADVMRANNMSILKTRFAVRPGHASRWRLTAVIHTPIATAAVFSCTLSAGARTRSARTAGKMPRARLAQGLEGAVRLRRSPPGACRSAPEPIPAPDELGERRPQRPPPVARHRGYHVPGAAVRHPARR